MDLKFRTMLAIERHNKILNLLDQFGTVRTVDLANNFSVTDETIRRDLQILADKEKLMRIHGGASSTSGRPTLSSFEERSSINTPHKKSIAKIALHSVQPGKTYAFDSSTTALALVYMLPNLPFRVITNALAVIQWLVNNDNIEDYLNRKKIEKFNIIFLDPPFADNKYIKELKLIKKNKIYFKNHLIIIHRERKTDDDINGIFKPLIIKKYSRSKIIFGKF